MSPRRYHNAKVALRREYMAGRIGEIKVAAIASLFHMRLDDAAAAIIEVVLECAA